MLSLIKSIFMGQQKLSYISSLLCLEISGFKIVNEFHAQGAERELCQEFPKDLLLKGI